MGIGFSRLLGFGGNPRNCGTQVLELCNFIAISWANYENLNPASGMVQCSIHMGIGSSRLHDFDGSQRNYGTPVSELCNFIAISCANSENVTLLLFWFSVAFIWK